MNMSYLISLSLALLEALDDMEAFMDKVMVFQDSDSFLGEEVAALVAHHNDNAAQLLKVKVQYIESAMAFALLFLSQPEEAKKAGKDPEALKKILQEQFVTIASTEGLEEMMIQPGLFEAAQTFRLWVL